MFWLEGLGFYSILPLCVCGADCMGLNLMHVGKVPCLWARSQDSIFNVLRNHLTALHTSILHSWKWGTKSPGLHFLLSIVFLIVTVMGVDMVVLICIFLMINEAENLFMRLLPIYTSLKKRLFKTFARFLKSACISAFELHTSISFTLYDRKIHSVYKNH